VFWNNVIIKIFNYGCEPQRKEQIYVH